MVKQTIDCVSDSFFFLFFFCNWISATVSLRRRGLGNLPHKVSADGAEGGLVEEDGRELVVPDDMDLGLLDSSSPPVQRGDSILGHHLYRLLTRHCGRKAVKVHKLREKGSCRDHYYWNLPLIDKHQRFELTVLTYFTANCMHSFFPDSLEETRLCFICALACWHEQNEPVLQQSTFCGRLNGCKPINELL